MKSARVIPRSHAGFWQNISNTRQIINMENGQFRNQEIKLKSFKLHGGSETRAVKIISHLVPEQNEVQGQSSYDCRNTIILIEAVPKRK